MTEEQSQRLRHREHELPAWKVQENLVRQVLGEQERPLPAARRAQIEALAAEGSEVVMTTSRIGAPDAGHRELVVSSGHELVADIADAVLM